MAVDTRDRRASVLGFALAALAILPSPGTIDQPDRQQLAYSYRLTAETPEPPTPTPTEQVVGIVTRPQPRPVFIVGTFDVVARPPRLSAVGDVENPPPADLVARDARVAATGEIALPLVLGSADVAVEPTGIVAKAGVYQSVSTRPWKQDQPVRIRGLFLPIETTAMLDSAGTVERQIVMGEGSVEALGAIERQIVTGEGTVTAATGVMHGRTGDVDDTF